MKPMHSLLKRQLRRHVGSERDVPPDWRDFVQAVENAYRASDVDRQMLERSLELSSQELVDANAEMRAVFQAIPDLVLRLDRHATVLEAKAGACGSTAIEVTQFLGKPVGETPIRAVAPDFLEAIGRVLATGGPADFEYCLCGTGIEVCCEARLVPLPDGQVLAMIRDISERKRAEKRAQQDLLTMQRAAEAAQALTQHRGLESISQLIADGIRSVIGAHRCQITITGLACPQTLGGSISLSEEYMAQGRGQPPAAGRLATALKNRTGETIGTVELTGKYEGDFSPRDRYVAEQLTHTASSAIENLALIEEIRLFNAQLEARVAERSEALRQQEALFQAAADQAPQAIWIVNTQGAVTYLNRYWYELVGSAPPRWHGHEWMEVVPPEDVAEMRRQWLLVKDNGGVFAGTRRIRSADGTLHTTSYRASPVRGADGRVCCWIGMDADITELKTIEEALRLSNRELEAFSYSVSHDLRAPLSSIDGFSKVLDEQRDSLDSAKLHHYIDRIRCSATRMSQLIDSLLALAQISRKQLRPVSVDLSAIAESVVAELRARAPERRVRVTVEPGLRVMGDAGLLAAAVENLVGNAWKFTSRCSDAQIAVGCTVCDGEPTIYVADNGAGFDMDYVDKLFGTFQRLHSADEFPGTGVGLATVRRIIDRHGGKVWAESQPDQGAKFSFTVPNTRFDAGDDALCNRRNDSRFGALT